MDSTSLVFAAHNQLLRALTSHGQHPYQGLTSAARSLRSLLSNRSRKRLIALDNCFSVLCHLTEVGVNSIILEITNELAAAEISVIDAAPALPRIAAHN
eukprot:11343903-Prorocentrum_lima.AAC.1